MAVARKKTEKSRVTRISRVYFNRMFPKRMDALKVALSVFLGVFIGIMPTIGIAIILTVLTSKSLTTLASKKYLDNRVDK